MCHCYLNNENHWVLFEERHVTVGYLLVGNILSPKSYLTVQLTILLLEFVRNSQQVPVISLSSIRKHLYIWYSSRPFIVTYCWDLDASVFISCPYKYHIGIQFHILSQRLTLKNWFIIPTVNRGGDGLCWALESPLFAKYCEDHVWR